MSGIKTTIKTEICAFSEFRIYPGRGTKFIARDGKTHIFFSHRCRGLATRHRKPAKLRWTQPWRRAHKKLRSSDLVQKRRTRRTAKVQKAIVGLSLQKMKEVKATVKSDTALVKEAKEKQKKKVAEKKPATTQKGQQVPKMQKGAKVQTKNYKKL